MKNKQLLNGSIYFVVLLFSVFFAGRLVAEEAKETLKVGAVLSLTGPGQFWAENARMGLELARDEINMRGGIQGKKLELIVEDSRTNPTQSVTAYKKLINFDKVRYVIGDVWGFVTAPIIPLAERDGVIHIGPNFMDTSLEKLGKTFFSMGHTIKTISNAVDGFFQQNPSIKTAAIFCWDDGWGSGYLGVWRSSAARNGVKILAEICSHDFTNDFRSDVAKVARLKPDAVIVAHLAEVVLRRMKEQQFYAKVLTTSNVVEVLKYQKNTAQVLEGVYFTSWTPNEEFVVSFREKFGRAPLLEAYNSYESLKSVANSLKQGKGDPVKDMESLRYMGVAGEVDFSSSRFGNKSVAQLYQIKDGQMYQIKDGQILLVE